MRSTLPPLIAPARRSEVSRVGNDRALWCDLFMPGRVSFRESLDQLWTEMAAMAAHNTIAIERATLALSDANRQLAELVITEQADVAGRQEDVEKQVVDLIALQQPVAGDLRVVISAIPMSGALARMGDLAAHVAQTTRLRAPDSAIPDEVRDVFDQIGRAAVTTAADLQAALTDRDSARATAIQTSDHIMDGLHRDLFTILLKPSWPHSTEAAIDVTLLGRFYERFADQAVNVARRIHFIIEGT
jgi:phosphate transport system protein